MMSKPEIDCPKGTRPSVLPVILMNFPRFATRRNLSRRLLWLAFGYCAVVVLSSCRDLPSPEPGQVEMQPFLSIPDAPSVAPATTQSLQALFSDLDYSWERLDEGVPLFLLEQFPDDLAHQDQQRKRTFFMGLLPLVLMANEEIREERRQAMDIFLRYDRQGVFDDADLARLDRLKERYGLKGNPLLDDAKRIRLIRRIDTLPPSLVLAQAANESAWGTSRFAREGNNLFGEWTFQPGTGIVPEQRPAGATYEVRIFPSLYESVRSYMNNLNTHSAYAKLRDIRASLRHKGQSVSGRDLVHGLKRYSIRRDDYVAEIDSMIRQNRLSRVNRVALRKPEIGNNRPLESAGSGLLSSRDHATSRSSTIGKNPEL